MHAAPLSTLIAVVARSGAVGMSASRAQDACSQLWVARNSIYKAYGYCFKTARAISYFGNAGCMYDREGDIPLSRADRAQIRQIIAQERAYGCR
jgi:hypothetical protein